MGFTLAPQVYPNTRTSNAASVQLKYYLPWRAALTAQYRYFHDTWGIVANTTELDYTLPVWQHWIFDGSLRYYQQTHASFYSDLFPRADYQNFDGARPRAGRLRELHGRRRAPPTSSTCPGYRGSTRSTANVRVDHLLIDYSDFRDALLAAEYGAGNEPLYQLNANIFQVFVSIWY